MGAAHSRAFRPYGRRCRFAGCRCARRHAPRRCSADILVQEPCLYLAFYAGCKVDKFVPDVVVSGAETLDVCGLDVRVIHTPGHTSGGVCYVVGDSIFSGDTLFELSYGRTDFPTGSFKELKNSVVNKLFALKGDYKVYPGHGAPTTLQFEREHNPILTD